MKKLLKFLLWTFVGILALVLVLVLTIPLWLGPTVATVATKVTPEFTGTPFVLESASLNPYTGKFSITKLTLGNPDGYPVPTAFSVSNVTVDVEMSSLFSDTIHIREISIIDPYASYVSNDGTNNFEWILAHVNEKIGPKKDKEEDKGPGKKVVIDKLTIAGTRVKLKILPEMPIPTITLNDIGKESKGATWEEVGQMLADSFMKATSAIGDGLTSVLGALGDGANSLMGGATNVLGGAASAIGGATTNLLDGASDALGGATKAIGDTAKKIGNLGGLLGGDDESKTSETNKSGEAEKPATGGGADAAKSAGKSVIDAGKSLGNGALDAGKSIGNGALDAGKSVGNGALDAGKSVGEGLKKLNPFGK